MKIINDEAKQCYVWKGGIKRIFLAYRDTPVVFISEWLPDISSAKNVYFLEKSLDKT
jgi:hypothetical protein